MDSQNTISLTKLRQSWFIFLLISLTFLSAGAFSLGLTWQMTSALRWLLLAALTIAYLAIVFWRNLDQNHRMDETVLLPNLGWGNWVTLSRGILIAGVIGFLFSPWPPGWLAWLPGSLYLLAVLADALDGYLARKSDHLTRLGTILDISFDGLGVLAAATLLVQYGQAPVWYLLVALARYIFLTGEWLLKRRGKNINSLRPSNQRKVFASAQFVFIAIILFPVFKPPLTILAAACFGLPFLVGFALDFMQVSGAPPLKSRVFLRLRRSLPIIQVGTRVMLAILAVLAIRQVVLSDGLSLAPALLLFFQSIAALLVLFGIAGRLSAGAALALVGLGSLYFAPDWVQALQVVGYVVIILWGSGRYSLWSPEEVWYVRPIGTRRPVSLIRTNHETYSEAH